MAEGNIKKTEVIDLCRLNTKQLAEEGVWLQLTSPETGLPLSSRIKVSGTDAERYRQQIRKTQDRRLGQQMSGGFRTPRVKAVDYERDRIENLVKLTMAWENMVEDGKELECTPDNVRHVYSDPGWSWIADQVDRFAGDQANFIKS